MMSHCIEGEEFRGVQVPFVDMWANLHPREAELLHTAPHLQDGQVRGLHGQRT